MSKDKRLVRMQLLSQALKEPASGEKLVLRSQLDGVGPEIFTQLQAFAKTLGDWGYKPYGWRGRQLIHAAATELRRTSGYDSSVCCSRCHKQFMAMLDNHLVNLFLKHWKDYSWFDKVVLCKDCGGNLNEIADQVP